MENNNIENSKRSVHLEGARLVLREIRSGDGESIVKQINNLRVSQYMLVIPFPYTISDAKWWVDKCLAAQAKAIREEYSFGLTLKPFDEVIGGVGVSKVDHFQGRATMGYWLGEEYHRRGLMFEAMNLALDFAFNKLNLRRVDISAFAENVASNGLIKKLGFVFEGKRLQSCVSKATGRIHDENIYGLLKSDWINKETLL